MSVITNAGIVRLIDYLDTDITHVGIGTGAEPLDSDLLLDSETERKASANIIDGNTLIVEGYWDETEANGVTYLNTGCFGDGATITLDSGELFSGGPISAIKDNTQSLTISIEITVEVV